MAEFMSIGDITANTVQDLHKEIREQQYQNRRTDVLEMRQRQRDQNPETEEEEKIPVDVLTTDDALLMDRKYEIRPRMLRCETIPDDSSYCDGCAHMRRRYSDIWRRWDWFFYEHCPVSFAEWKINKVVRKQAKQGGEVTVKHFKRYEK